MTVKFTLRSILLVLAFLGSSIAQADYYIFAGGHVGNTYYDEINYQEIAHELDESQVGNSGYDVMASWGNKDYGIGLTYTSGNHVVKGELTGIRMHQTLSGPGIIFTTIYKNPQDAKTMTFIGVEALTLNTSNTNCSANQVLCDDFEKEFDGTSASSVIMGIMDTASSGLAIGIEGRAFKSESIELGYELNLLIGIAL